MSAVSTASAAPAGLGTLLGGAPEASGFGGSSAKTPSSFGTALALAERMLDAGAEAETVMRPDAAPGASSEVTVPAESADVTPPLGGEHEGEAASDAGLSPLDTVFAEPPIAPGTGSAAVPVTVDDGDAADAQAASRAQGADVFPTADADSPVIPVALATAASARAGDARPVDAAPAVVAATPAPASGAPVARAEPAPAPAPSVPAAAATLPVAPAATTAPKEGSAPPDQPVPPTPAPSPTASVVTVSPTSAPAGPAPDAAAAAPRTVAAQVAPVVLSIVQRPVGSHQLTMTVNPDTLGPVTVRAHISAGGEVRVELLGVSDAGRDALRAIVTDLRRDLAAVMPHATLTLGSSTAADGGSPDRGAQLGSGGAAGEQAPGERGRAPLDGRRPAESSAGVIPRSHPITTRAVSGEGLDIFA